MKNDVKKEVKKECNKAKRNVGWDGLAFILAIIGFVCIFNGASASETVRTPQQKKADIAKVITGTSAIVTGAGISAYAKRVR